MIQSIVGAKREPNIASKLLQTRYTLLLAFIAILSLSACGPKGPSFFQIENSLPELPAANGRIYFINTSGGEARLAIDKTLIGKCRSGAFFWEDVQAGSHIITADAWGAFGAWDQPVDIVAGKDHYIRIKDRRAAAVALGVFGVIGSLTEAAVATEGQSGPFEVEVLDEITGKEERAKLVFLRDGYTPKASVPASPPAVTPQTSVERTTTTKKTEPQVIKKEEASKGQGNCSVDQILSMKTSGLQDKQIKAACK